MAKQTRGACVTPTLVAMPFVCACREELNKNRGCNNVLKSHLNIGAYQYYDI